MAFSLLPELLIVSSLVLIPVLSYIIVQIEYRRSKKQLLPTDWPIVGMLPSLVANLHNFHEYGTAVLTASGHNFTAHGPPASGMRFFITCDPVNIRHIFTSNHANYLKGQEFGEIFDVVAGSVFTIDGEPCRRERAKIHGLLSSRWLLASIASCWLGKVRGGLLPFLTRMASTGAPFDMQDLIARFVFDLTATLVFSVDPGLLSPGMPPMHVPAALQTVMEVALFRHALPASCWKAMRLLNIGPERNLAAAHRVLHDFTAEMMVARKATTTHHGDSRGGDAGERAQQEASAASSSMDILSCYEDDPYYNADDALLRATLINYMIAGGGTIGTALSWFFYNLAMKPHVLTDIRRELAPIASRIAAAGSSSNGGNADTTTAAPAMVTFEPEDTKPLVYLQAALYETLRLYPPAPFVRKCVVAGDVMPSGDEVQAGDTVLIHIYSMGRMEDLWGKDCREYRPERWLQHCSPDDDGGQTKLRHEPTHKFLSFNSGTRMCPGKDIAMTQLKAVAAAVVWNFDVEVVEGQAVEPKLSCVLEMKNGLMVKVKKRTCAP